MRPSRAPGRSSARRTRSRSSAPSRGRAPRGPSRTTSTSSAGSTSATPAFGGSVRISSDRTATTASSGRRRPERVAEGALDARHRRRASPKTVCSASDSAASERGVPVPCALTQPMSDGRQVGCRERRRASRRPCRCRPRAGRSGGGRRRSGRGPPTTAGPPRRPTRPLQHDEPGALTQRHPAPAEAEGRAAVGRHRAHPGEPDHGDARERLHPAGERDVDPTGRDRAGRGPDRVVAGGTGGSEGSARSGDPELRRPPRRRTRASRPRRGRSPRSRRRSS